MNLGDLQQYVWNQTDTTDVDLSAVTIASYIDEAFTRTIAAENRWPFYEQAWELTQIIGNWWLDLTPDVDVPSILSVYSVEPGPRLQQISQEEAEDRFATQPIESGTPTCYSLWARKLYLWPAIINTIDVKFLVRGYRKPLTTFDASTGQVDADPRLHQALAHYACALAYAQQEDDVLEARYMDRWQRDVEMVRRVIMEPPGHRPLVMHGNFQHRRGVPSSAVSQGVVRLP